MSLQTYLNRFRRWLPGGRPAGQGGGKRQPGRRAQPALEALEDRLALSPFMVQGTQLIATGTPGTDYFTFSSTNGVRQANLNGVSYTVDPAHITSIVFNGQGGAWDLAEVYGVSGGYLLPQGGSLTAAGIQITVQNTATIIAYSDGHAGESFGFYGNGRNDTFGASPGAGYMYGSGYFNYGGGFSSIVAYGNPQGGTNAPSDVAYLNGSGQNDTLNMVPTSADLEGSGYYLHAVAFGHVVATDSGSMSDWAYLWGSGRDALYTARGNYSSMLGYGYFNEAYGFGVSSGYNGGSAIFYYLPTDFYTGGTTWGLMNGNGYSDFASGFTYVNSILI
jgi:hypothetical protein